MQKTTKAFSCSDFTQLMMLLRIYDISREIVRSEKYNNCIYQRNFTFAEFQKDICRIRISTPCSTKNAMTSCESGTRFTGTSNITRNCYYQSYSDERTKWKDRSERKRQEQEKAQKKRLVARWTYMELAAKTYPLELGSWKDIVEIEKKNRKLLGLDKEDSQWLL